MHVVLVGDVHQPSGKRVPDGYSGPVLELHHPRLRPWRGVAAAILLPAEDGGLSIEHEDVLLNSLEGLEKSVALPQGVMPAAPADYAPQAI